MIDIESQILERLEQKNALLFTLSDTLDVKASIVLVLITFLASQTSGFLFASDVADWGLFRYLQVLAAFVLAVAGTLAVLTLWPRKHEAETAEDYDQWLRDLRDYYKDSPTAEDDVAKGFLSGRMLRLKESILAHTAIDGRKANFLSWCFGATAVALGLNLATLIWLAL